MEWNGTGRVRTERNKMIRSGRERNETKRDNKTEQDMTRNDKAGRTGSRKKKKHKRSPKSRRELDFRVFKIYFVERQNTKKNKMR